MAWTGSGIFTQTIKDILDATVSAYDIDTDTMRVALFNNNVTPDFDAVAASIAYGTGTWEEADEVTHANWTAKGSALASPTLTTASPAAGQLKYDAADIVSADSTTLSNIYGCLIFNDTIASPVADQGLLAVYFSSGPYSTTNGTLTIQWDTNGIFYLDLVP